jgi:hypothetical protein
MTRILTIVLLFFSAPAFAQRDSLSIEQRLAKLEIDNYKAGALLKQHANTYYTGICISVGGIALSGGAAIMESSSINATPLFIIGGVASLIGTVISITSHSKINDAGIQLRGYSVNVPIKPKKK